MYLVGCLLSVFLALSKGLTEFKVRFVFLCPAGQMERATIYVASSLLEPRKVLLRTLPVEEGELE